MRYRHAVLSGSLLAPQPSIKQSHQIRCIVQEGGIHIISSTTQTSSDTQSPFRRTFFAKVSEENVRVEDLGVSWLGSYHYTSISGPSKFGSHASSIQ